MSKFDKWLKNNGTEILKKLYKANSKKDIKFKMNDSSLIELDVSDWDVSKFKSLQKCFYGYDGLEMLNVKNWDVENVFDLSSCFLDCQMLKELDLSNWHTDSLQDLYRTFNNCYSLKKITFGKDFSTKYAQNLARICVPV